MTNALSVSIADISKKVGFSQMTISRVIRNSGDVSPETRSKIVSAIKEMGYVPSQSARALRKGSRSLENVRTCCSLIFGCETQDSVSFFNDIAKSAEMEAIKNGLCLLQTHWQNDFEESWKRLASAFSVPGLCGLILAGQFLAEEVKMINKYCENIVIIDGPVPEGVSAASVEADYDKGSDLALTHLASAGAKKVLVMTGPRKDHYFAQAVQRAVDRQLGLFELIDVEYIDMTYESGVKTIKEKFQESKMYDAVFTNDEIGLVTLKTFIEMGIKVPDDIQVMGFDNISYSNYSFPSLSTVHIDKTYLGREAIKTLVESLDAENKKDIVKIKKIIQPVLVVRKSTRG